MVGIFLFPKRPMDTEIVSTIFFRVGGLSYVKTDVNKNNFSLINNSSVKHMEEQMRTLNPREGKIV